LSAGPEKPELLWVVESPSERHSPGYLNRLPNDGAFDPDWFEGMVDEPAYS
jgi:hypothetical protein